MVGSAVFGVGYVQQRPVKEALAVELTVARQSLSELDSMSEEQRAEEARRVQEELAAAKAEVESEKLAVAEAVRTLEQEYASDMLSTGGILKGIFELAADNRVDVVAVSAGSDGGQTRGGQSFLTLALDLKVVGRLSNLAAFVNELETGSVKSVAIDNIAITGEGSMHTADLELSVLYPDPEEGG
jgi:hypothetical protein